jgi:Stigma-specific protein, Stig1
MTDKVWTKRLLMALGGLVVVTSGGCGKDDKTAPPPSANCPAGLTSCGDSCVDAAVDPANCGACGTACSDGESCVAGQCSSACGAGTTDCGGACVDTALDPANCGSCGTACAAGELCSAGGCGLECVGGTALCAGACVDTNVDPANCGGCGVSCSAGETCVGGACEIVCSGGLTGCGGACIDISQSKNNCGGCGNACGAGELCVGSSCQAGALYGIVGRTKTVGDLYTIDPATGVGTSVQTMALPYAGLTFDDDGLLYGIVPDFDNKGGLVHQINIATGKAIVVALGGYEPRGLTRHSPGVFLTCGLNDNHQYATLSFGDAVPVAIDLPAGDCDHRTSFATDAAGTIFYTKSSTSELGTIAPDGTETQIATFADSSYRTGLSFHNGTLYAVEKATGNLVSIDTATAAVTTIGAAPTDLKALASTAP